MNQPSKTKQPMENQPSENNQQPEEAVKWDYTNREQTLVIGAVVVGLNLVVVLLAILYNTVPAVHSFFSGKPM